MTAGRARWVERMREAKAMGLIERFPGGRPKGRTRALKPEAKLIARARDVVASEQAKLPVQPATPWQDQTHAERLDTLTGKALEKTREILDLPCDPTNLKLLSIQKDAALSVLSTQVKVDANGLQARKDDDKLGELLRRIREADAVSDPRSLRTDLKL